MTTIYKIYQTLRSWQHLELPPLVNPRAVFVNNELDLESIAVYGFDYDYTLAVYTRKLNNLIYKLALNRLIEDYKYPRSLLDEKYDNEFAIRGLHFDVQTSCLLKVDAFSQIQRGTVYRGRRKLTDDEISQLYPGFGLPEKRGRELPQLIDFFSLPWAGLLATVIHYCDRENIAYNPNCLFNDSRECVQKVHTSGDMYQNVMADIESYIHPNQGLKEYLEMLNSRGKELFVVTNSPFKFIDAGLTYMLGKDWRRLFKYIVVSAKKPKFFTEKEPFRLYNSVTGSLSFERVLTLESGKIYAGGHIEELAKGAGFTGKNVLYFGDHIYTDLAEPMLRLGWRTAAIVPDLSREIRTQNTDNYRTNIQWIEILTALIERFQVESSRSPETHKIMETWKEEREKLRFDMKEMFNAQFGSVFRTYNTMTYFSRRLSDVYTSRVTNFMHYDCNHTFYPRRNALPHENLHSVPVLSSVIALDAVHARSQSDDVNSQKNGVTQNGNYLKINNNANHNDKY
ncbi:hypothetical protein WR25_19155 [Diploscapter pachys]|uniref:5'-nucleotidase domain-containing protein 3 n=1 Tax=Diploscapter pachys TaxID=2018661 RepID=A0A2A2KHH7_9BILA|nr:hypothetical protein WR25_19155 [Diploscapter pachys]